METPKIKIEKKSVLYGPNGGGKSHLIRTLLADAPSIAKIHITECKVWHNTKIFDKDEFSLNDSFAINDPIAKRLDVYYDKVYDPDLGWIPIRHLSYGQRRRLVIEAALEGGDFVAIENFEAGLHVDYIVELIKRIAETDATVILESHSGLVLRLAMRYGIAMFYVSNTIKQIEKFDDKMFAKELSAYNAIIV